MISPGNPGTRDDMKDQIPSVMQNALLLARSEASPASTNTDCVTKGKVLFLSEPWFCPLGSKIRDWQTFCKGPKYFRFYSLYIVLLHSMFCCCCCFK